MAKLRRDQVMVATEMVERGTAIRQVARQLGVAESGLRDRLKRPADAPDGRRDRASALDGWEARIDAVLARFGETPAEGQQALPASVLHEVLVREHGFTGSYQAVRRYLRRRFAAPPVQAVRRVETPPGVQAQHDWFEWQARVDGEHRPLYGLIGTLAHCRATFVWVSPTMTQLAWQTGHLALFHRYGGVPLWVRIDNLATAVASGAGPTAIISDAFRTFARTCGFAVDPCRAATGSDKGKVERQVRAPRSAFADLLAADWGSLPALQGALDTRAGELLTRRQCPVTGTTVGEALAAERPHLRPLPAVHEPFDCVVARGVSRDCLVSFEGRRYSVPFAWVGRQVEVRGTAQHVVVLAEGAEIARHPRQTMRRLVLDAAHYEGPSTDAVRAPTPLGHRARLQLATVIDALPAPARVARPLADYVALLEPSERRDARIAEVCA
jgi:transposase